MSWKHHFRTSPARLGRIAVFSGVLFGLAWFLPSVTRVDMLRPQILDGLQSLSGHPVSLGHIYVRLLPTPGLVATDLVVFAAATRREPLLRVRQVGLSFYARPLLKLKLRIRRLSLNAPHGFLQRPTLAGASAGSMWINVLAPAASPAAFPLESVTVRQGEIDFTDETIDPPLRLSLKSIEMTEDVTNGRASLDARDPALGAGSKVHVTYVRNSSVPLHFLFGNVSTRSLTPYWPAAADWMDGSLDLEAAARAPDTGAVPNQLAVDIRNWRPKALGTIDLAGHVILSTESVHLNFHTEGASPESYVDLKSPWPRGPVTVRASLEGLSPSVAALFTFSPWLTRLRGHGHIDALWHYRPGSFGGDWQATGRGFHLDGTALELTQVVCSNDAAGLHVHVEAAGAVQQARVDWEPSATGHASDLTVDASSITLRDVLQVLAQSTAPVAVPTAESERHFRPEGVQDLTMASAHLEATLTPGEDLEITHARAALEGGRLEASGGADLTSIPAFLHLQGAYHQWPVQAVAARLISGPPILSGTGEMTFSVQCAAGTGWLKSLSGPITLKIAHGTLFELKTFYRISSLIDLSNFFKLRLPDVAAHGIPFDELGGTLTFARGRMTTRDLFLSSPNMKITGHGTIDWPAARIDATVEFQLLHFVEDVITHLPGLHWIFKDGHKILLPIPMNLQGPLNDISIS